MITHRRLTSFVVTIVLTSLCAQTSSAGGFLSRIFGGGHHRGCQPVQTCYKPQQCQPCAPCYAPQPAPPTGDCHARCAQQLQSDLDACDRRHPDNERLRDACYRARTAKRRFCIACCNNPTHPHCTRPAAQIPREGDCYTQYDANQQACYDTHEPGSEEEEYCLYEAEAMYYDCLADQVEE